MKGIAALLALAATLQLAMLGGFAWLWEAAYGAPRRVAEAWEGPLTATGLVLGGPLALLVAACAFHRSLCKVRAPWLRWALAGLALPSILLGALASHVGLCVAGMW